MKLYALTLTTAAALAVALSACGGSSPTAAPEAGVPGDATSATVADAPTEAPVATEAPAAAPGVGVAVKVGDSEWTVDAVEDKGQTLASGNDFIDDLTTSGRFVQVNLRVKGTGADPVTVSAAKVKDSAGREFEANSDAAIMINTDASCIYETINPGLEVGCVWVYEIPADGTGLRLMAVTGMFDSPVEIDLGQ